MIDAEINVPGCCVFSGEPVFYVVKTWPVGHELAGRPQAIGGPLPNAMRVTLVLVNGIAEITVAESQLDTLAKSLPAVWRKCLRSSIYEEKTRLALGGPPRKDASFQDALCRDMNNIPIGVLAVRRWSDIWNKEK